MNPARLVERGVRVLSSYGLACVLLILLFVLTLFGTLEQASHGLHDVRVRYFESFVVVPDLVPIPLPGAYPLLALLAVNLVVGGIVRMPRKRKRAGVLVIHLGILLLLAGSFIEDRVGRKGHLTLFEGERGGQFESWYEWEVVVTEELSDGRAREHVVPNDRFAGLGVGDAARFVSDALPFDLSLSGFLRNCRPRQATHGAVDGFVLEERAPEMDAERNIAGVSAALAFEDGGRADGLLWGLERAPWSVVVGGRTWRVGLRKRTWPLPFDVHLREFHHELHPGTGIPASFESDVTCTASSVAQDVTISMNEPLRRDGFILYQASWGPANASPGDRLFSTFAVVENPADRVPLIACVVIALGLLAHFVPRLARHVRRSIA